MRTEGGVWTKMRTEVGGLDLKRHSREGFRPKMMPEGGVGTKMRLEGGSWT